MFTGIVEAAGTVQRVAISQAGARVEIRAPRVASEVRLGDSVAVNGCCLTVVEIADGALGFDAVLETLRRTNLGDLSEGDLVNLERPLRAGGSLDGHIVQGHVDGVGVLHTLESEGHGYRLGFRCGKEILRYIVEKGSIAVDGISLTVAALDDAAGTFQVAIIPHTWTVTNLPQRHIGDRVNLEVDLLAKYVERLLSARLGSD